MYDLELVHPVTDVRNGWFYCSQLTTYEAELEEMKNMSRQEYVASLRRYFDHLSCCVPQI